MATTLRDLLVLLDAYLPKDLTIPQALQVVLTVMALFPLLRLHSNQRRQPRQPQETGWKKRTLPIIRKAFREEGVDDDDEYVEEYAHGLYRDATAVFEYLGLDVENDDPPNLVPAVRPILCTRRKECIII